MPLRYLHFVALLLLAGCATQPDSSSADRTDTARITAHQAELATIQSWEFQARMAFFNDRDDERHTASIRWQYSPQQIAIRLTHPLRGALAELEESAGGAVLTDREGNQFYAQSMRELLRRHLGIMLPVSLINDALLGRHPALELTEPTYYEDGTLAAYQVRLPGTGQHASTGEVWTIEFSNYQEAAQSSILLPHRLHLESDDYRIRLAVTRWQVNQDAERD